MGENTLADTLGTKRTR